MEAVYIRRLEGKWAGFAANDKQVTKPACKNCVLKLLMKMTKNSTRYNQIIIVDKDKTEVHKTGVVNAGNAEES